MTTDNLMRRSIIESAHRIIFMGDSRWPTGASRIPAVFDGFHCAGGDDIRNIRSAVLNDVHIFGPSTVNEVRFGYSRKNGSSIGVAPQGVGFAKENNIALFLLRFLGFPNISFNYSGLQNSPTQFLSWGGGIPTLVSKR